MEPREKTVVLDAEVASQVLSIIEKAGKYVTFVTPYLKLWRHIQTAIDNAVTRGVKVTFIVRASSEMNYNDLEWLASHNVEVLVTEWLHAKIYLNESRVLISSMNITEQSITNASEFAMYVEDRADAKRFRDYVSSLKKKAQLIKTYERAGEPVHSILEERNVATGRCIRCSRQIVFDPLRPLCEDCYQAWSVFENPDYAEKYCHKCGKPAQVTYDKPLCEACYRSQNFGT